MRSASGQAAVHTDATAVLAFNDLRAIGSLERLVERGLRVPANMSVVRCDDILGADATPPSPPPSSGPAGVATDMLDLLSGSRGQERS